MFVVALFDWSPRASKHRLRLVGVVEDPELVGATIARLAVRRQSDEIEQARDRGARMSARRPAAGGREGGDGR